MPEEIQVCYGLVTLSYLGTEKACVDLEIYAEDELPKGLHEDHSRNQPVTSDTGRDRKFLLSDQTALSTCCRPQSYGSTG